MTQTVSVQTLQAERRPKGAWWRVLLTALLLYVVGVAVLLLTGNPQPFSHGGVAG